MLIGKKQHQTQTQTSTTTQKKDDDASRQQGLYVNTASQQQSGGWNDQARDHYLCISPEKRSSIEEFYKGNAARSTDAQQQEQQQQQSKQEQRRRMRSSSDSGCEVDDLQQVSPASSSASPASYRPLRRPLAAVERTEVQLYAEIRHSIVECGLPVENERQCVENVLSLLFLRMRTEE